jgi:hypothetical protein
VRALIGVLVIGVACGGSPRADTTASPAGSGRELTSMDPDLSAIAKFAARSLQPSSDGKVHFGGVFVGGRPLRALADTIARAIGATLEEAGSGRVPYTIGRVGSSAGEASRADATYTLRSFRVRGDTAFVGSDARSAAEPEGALCITLARSGGEWRVLETRVISSVPSCGKG